MFLDFLWKRRRTGRSQSVVLGDEDEHLMVLPSDTAAWVVAKFNEMTGRIDSLQEELNASQRALRSRNAALVAIRDAVRPYVVCSALMAGIPNRVMSAVNSELK